MRTKLRNWFYCLWNGHQFRETDRHNFDNGDIWIRRHCIVCGEVDIKFIAVKRRKA